MQPYIGITDFETFQQVQETTRLFSELSSSVPEGNRRKLMVGVMMSYKTLRGLPSKWTSVWPSKERVGEIFQPHEQVLNTLHYADYDNKTQVSDLLEAVSWANRFKGLDAIQFDMPWPAHRMIAELMNRFEDAEKKGLQIILQVGRVAIEQCQGDLERVLDRIEWYQHFGGCILFDLSGGNGIPLDAELVLGYLRAMQERFPGMPCATAGGLGPDTMHLLDPIIVEFPRISIDAQGKLRTSGKATDPIDWELAHVYLQKSIEKFNKKSR